MENPDKKKERPDPIILGVSQSKAMNLVGMNKSKFYRLKKHTNLNFS
jgi:hypothetical protein